MSVSRERLGQLFILVGPGGVGKNALMNELIQEMNDLRQLPTATTRPIRPGEKEGREHQFVNLSTFEKMIAEGALIEYQEVHPGKFYGVPRATVEQAIAERQGLIADIEVLGTKIIRSQYPHNSVSIFIAPPSIASLEQRLRGRQASPEDIRDRINRLPMEMLYAPLSDHLIVNDDFDAALNDMHSIVDAVRSGRDVATDHIPTQHYEAQVTIKHADEILYTDVGDTVLKSSFQRQSSSQVVTQLLEDALNIDVDQAYLQYVRTGHHSALEIHYDADNHDYRVTYHYTYIMPVKSTPAGFTWRKQN